MKQAPGKHRLRKKELISNIFSLFSERYDSTDEKSIFDLSIPISEVQTYLEERCNVKYTSCTWIYTQIKRYEDILGVHLFKKINSNDDPESFSLAIYEGMTSYTQFQHLYLTHKLKIANGIYDQIKNSTEMWKKNNSLKILLGSGTNIYHLGNIIADRANEEKIHYHLYTHNLGVIINLMEPENISDYITLYTPAGMIDTIGNTIVGDDNNFYLSTEFDFIIQSTNTIYENKLYVHTKEESDRKRVILERCRGVKILALVMDEFKTSLDESMFCYGKLSDNDYVIVPKTRSKRESEYETMLKKMDDFMTPEIVHWNYVIYKIKK
jgi:hypothetical protein